MRERLREEGTNGIEREKQEREGGWMDRLMDGWMDGWMDGYGD